MHPPHRIPIAKSPLVVDGITHLISSFCHTNTAITALRILASLLPLPFSSSYR